MGCIYSDFQGLCTMWDPEVEDGRLGVKVSDKGEPICVVEDDPEPSDSCENYESDDPEEDWLDEEEV